VSSVTVGVSTQVTAWERERYLSVVT